VAKVSNETTLSWRNRIKALEDKSGIDKLIAIMSMLRDPENGCPWDLKQSFASIVPHTIEEAYEVADAIAREDFPDVKKELGDLLFQVVFYAQLGNEESLFDFDDIANTMSEKLLRRHPHVFGDTDLCDEAEIKAIWEQEKAKERLENNASHLSVLDDIPLAMPALSRAYKIQKRAASVGFDWPDVNGALDKVHEEIDEVKQELDAKCIDADKLADELGDLYFALTNVVRHLGFKPEEVVTKANQKFESRFRVVEQLAHQSSNSMTEMSLQQLDSLWEQAKALKSSN
jgi:ATP diphosphatase